MLSGEATHTNFIVFSLTRSGIEPTIYRTRGEHANHYATDDRGLLLTRKLLHQGFLLVKLKSSLRKFYGRHHDWVDVMEYLWHKWSRICSTIRSFPRSWLIAGFLTRVTRRVPLVGQELLNILEHLCSAPLPPVLSRVRVTRSLVLCFVDHCLTLCNF
jgi:hypothetical protein